MANRMMYLRRKEMKKLAFLCLWLIAGVTLFAQDLTLAQLNQKVIELERRIQLLEKVLSSQSMTSDTNSRQLPAGKESWRKLKKGMSKDEVRMLLGEPDRVTVSPSSTYWVFSDGQIIFDDSDRVSYWSEN
jgi:hypothetical protein